MKLAIVTVFILGVLFPSLAVAHPGHGHTAPESASHWLAEPAHLVVLAVAAGLVAWATRRNLGVRS
jgi:protein-S-isoprenylcysteine O-methyltransferase Ste14